jgi:hypothetical protein
MTALFANSIGIERREFMLTVFQVVAGGQRIAYSASRLVMVAR